jgi:hypothetical protein
MKYQNVSHLGTWNTGNGKRVDDEYEKIKIV